MGDPVLVERLVTNLIDNAVRHNVPDGWVQVATGTILEMAVPFARLDRTPGDPIRFYVELFQGDSSLDRAPREGVLELTTPSPEFERILWQV